MFQLGLGEEILHGGWNTRVLFFSTTLILTFVWVLQVAPMVLGRCLCKIGTTLRLGKGVERFQTSALVQSSVLILMTLFYAEYKSVGGAEKMIDVHSLSNGDSGDDHFLLHMTGVPCVALARQIGPQKYTG